MSILSNLRKTRNSLKNLLTGASKKIDANTLEMIEEALLKSDCGLETTDTIISSLKKSQGDWQPLLEQALQKILSKSPPSFDLLKELETHQKNSDLPYTILMIGVNGAGKTTTIGKLTHLLNINNKRTLLASADTFRAAASEQLTEWANRNQADIMSGHSKDPSAMIYTTIEKALSQKYDIVLADTAGRQFNQQGLMQELQKMHRTAQKFSPELPHQIWIVIDAGSGQNGVHQARAFQQAIPITGCIVTKLDGTAKGGMILSIIDQLSIPICYLGVGEKSDQLLPFNNDEFIAGFIPEEQGNA
jgi:fused signal recognition particle receptor